MTASASTIAAFRFGYGLAPWASPPADAAALLAEAEAGARAPLRWPPESWPGKAARLAEMQRLRRADRDDPAVAEMLRALRRGARDETATATLRRAASPHPFFERIVAFWENHFSVSGRGVGERVLLASYGPEAIRPNAMGRFADLTLAALRHPVMMRYLDQSVSIGPTSPAGRRLGQGLNENLAREALELHTLGVGAPYGQGDVRALAELMTGESLTGPGGAWGFDPDRAEPGPIRLLGRDYRRGRPGPGDLAEAVEDLARHPATARHLAGKLATHFVADRPPEGLIAHLVATWARTGGDLPRVYAALLEHPAAWEGFGAKVRPPGELVAGALRAEGFDGLGGEAPERVTTPIFRALAALDQSPWGPPGPDGWPEAAEAWITPPGLAARLAFAGRVGQRLAARPDLDPRSFAESALADALRPETAFAVGAAPERWEGFALAIASPEFNRR